MNATTNAPATAAPALTLIGSVTLTRDKDCKGSIRFATDMPDQAITNVYVSRICPGINNAKSVRVTIEIVS